MQFQISTLNQYRLENEKHRPREKEHSMNINNGRRSEGALEGGKYERLPKTDEDDGQRNTSRR